MREGSSETGEVRMDMIQEIKVYKIILKQFQDYLNYILNYLRNPASKSVKKQNRFFRKKEISFL